MNINIFEFMYSVFEKLIDYGQILWSFITYNVNISILGIDNIPMWAIIGSGSILLIILVKIVKGLIL